MDNTHSNSGAQSLRPQMGSQNYGAPYQIQFQPVSGGQPGQPFMQTTSATQQFRPVGQGMPVGQGQPPQFSQPMQQLPSRPGHLSSQAMSMPYMQQNMGFTSASQQFQNNTPPNNHPGLVGSGVPPPSSYTFATSYGQPQNTSVASQFQPISQMHASVVSQGGQPWLPPGSQGTSVITHGQQVGQQPLATAASIQTMNATSINQDNLSDWQEFKADGERRYYYNKRTKQSCWDKPLELMTPMERADASTVWKEFTTPEGKKYYYNKDTKESKWTIPEELKLAREQAEKEAFQRTQLGMVMTPKASDSITASATEQQSPAPNPVGQTLASTLGGSVSSPVAVTPTVSINSLPPAVGVDSSLHSTKSAGVVGVSPLGETHSPALTPGRGSAPLVLANASSLPMTTVEKPASQGAANSVEGASQQDIEEAKKGMAVAGKVNVTPLEEKLVDDEPLVYASKQDAKNAFKSLLESANVESDWSWEQTMRVIINDKRYGALKTLGERKQAFNEYLMQRKKLEAEERRLRQRKAKEEFTKMLEESKELTSSMRWSKAIALFEDDERFKAVERSADREDLYETYLVDLQKKERIKAQEEQRQNRLEYRQFLESCGLIKVDTQWRKVQDRLEDDERCSRLEKIDRLEIFQEYIRDLEKEEDEQRKIRKEQIKRVERKNRDEFRKMLEEHIADGTFTAKTYWRDYCLKVKDSPPYLAVASNVSGSTPKDLFEDAAEELERQYHEDKTRMKEAMKLGKITVASTWTFHDFKAAIKEGIDSFMISDVNLQLVFEDLLERAKEKEEKEAKKRQRLVKDFTDNLGTIKEITASSTWEECKELLEESSEYRAIGEESLAREIFEEYVARLLEKAKEKERKREEEKAKKEKEREEKEKRKEKERQEKEKEKEKEKKEMEKEKEKEREREREKEKGRERAKKEDSDSETNEATDSYGHKEDKKRDKDKERKHRKRHQSVAVDMDSDKEEREDSKKSRRHGSDRKKSRKNYSPESDTESKHKRHKRDHRDSSRRNGGGHEELEDGEVGEDGEIR